MQLQVIDKTTIAHDTLRVRFADPQARPLPAFAPGAHVELAFGGFSRRYSLTAPVAQRDYYEICVLRARPSRGGSAYLHERLAVGERVEVSEPRNAFPLDIAAETSLFVAGGIGITPFLSMTSALAHAGRRFELHYAARDVERLLPLPPEVEERSFYYVDVGGRAALDLHNVLERAGPEAHLYVCGPRALIRDLRLLARQRGWPDRQVHFESFGAVLQPGDRPVRLQLAASGMTIEAQPGQTLLEALLENGVWASYECRRGECASCATELLAGEPDHRDLCLTDAQREKLICTCISWAQSDELVLNL